MGALEMVQVVVIVTRWAEAWENPRRRPAEEGWPGAPA